jgi:hypothetical protein
VTSLLCLGGGFECGVFCCIQQDNTDTDKEFLVFSLYECFHGTKICTYLDYQLPNNEDNLVHLFDPRIGAPYVFKLEVEV